MLFIYMSLFAGLLLFGICYLLRNQGRKPSGAMLGLLFFTALLLRLIAAGLSHGFDNDTACFAAWADRIFQVGPRHFYSDTVFTDYPPGYMYVLYAVGGIRALFHIEYYSVAHLILLKLPSILSDLVCGFLVYRESKSRFNDSKPLLFCLLYLFNPVIILNSSVWGQVDSLYTLLVILICLSLVHGKTIPAYFVFCIGIVIKPQMLLFAPVLFLGVLDLVFLNDFSVQKLLRNLGYGMLSAAMTVLLILPFGFQNVWNQYFSTVSSYPYAAVNAYNLWGMLGLNWISQDTPFLGIPYRFWGAAAIILAFLIILAYSIRRRDDREKYPLLGALFLTTVFTCSVRMHERYLYPALLLLLFACIYLPSKRLYLCYSGFSLLHFCNTAHVLFFYDPSNYNRKDFFLLLVSAGTVAFLLLLYGSVFRLWGLPLGRRAVSAAWLKKDSLSSAKDLSLPPQPSQSTKVRLGRADIICMIVITLIYSAFALYDLGDRSAPSTSYEMAAGDEIALSFNLADGQRLCSFAYFIAPGHNRDFLLNNSQPITLQNVFTWQTIGLDGAGNQILLTLESSSASLLELVFLDQSGTPVTPVNAADYPALFDEAALYPGVSTFRNSMYFDEIYHARTAYEFVHGLTTYENTHPPLGKILISIGVLLFGMNPFGWRIIGTLFGIAMVPVIYLFARKLTGDVAPAALACVLFAFDFMHFTQTRLATIDVYITFFVLLMYYFMFLYTRMSFYDSPLKKTLLPLGASGICMGLGIACKWTGVYAGLGLAVIFFAQLLRRYREYRYASSMPSGRTAGISHRVILDTFRPKTIRTLLFCVVFFVLVPALIYLLSYLPFSDGSGDNVILRLLHNQQYMLSYHSGLDTTHPYSSSWSQWPIMQRPIWYYSRIVTGTAGAGGLREGISAFGNPLVWWIGIPAAFYNLYLGIKKKDRTAAFLLTGYLAQYLPWFFVTRITFIYHYFPSVAFVVLMIVHSLTGLKARMNGKYYKLFLILYAMAAVALFLLFYPVLSGQPVDAAFVSRYLRWFRTWVLCST